MAIADMLPVVEEEAADPGPEALVDPEDPVALTDQLAAILRARIAAGLIRRQLPSENDLKELHNVSRVTVRRALEALRDEGWVYSAPGRGWFVARDRRRS